MYGRLAWIPKARGTAFGAEDETQGGASIRMRAVLILFAFRVIVINCLMLDNMLVLLLTSSDIYVIRTNADTTVGL
jgi:hypothetical protein